MRASRWIQTVDTHTEGEPTRIVTGGIPPLPGSSVRAKRDHFREHLDHLRTALIGEPRGHRDMYGCILIPPSGDEADWGVFFMDNGGYMDMCGHATIGVSTALVELGMVERRSPRTRIRLATPAGLVESRVHVNGGRAVSAAFRNVASWADHLDTPIPVAGVGEVLADVAYGGNRFAFVDGDALGVDISLPNIEAVVDLGMRVIEAANRTLPAVNPGLPGGGRINIATILGRPLDPANSWRNVHVFGPRQFDRSPGGTGTSARMAALHARGLLRLDQEVRVESVTGGLFRGRLLEAVEIQGRSEVIPEVTGSAHLTGFHQFILDPDDRLALGFPSLPA